RARHPVRRLAGRPRAPFPRLRDLPRRRAPGRGPHRARRARRGRTAAAPPRRVPHRGDRVDDRMSGARRQTLAPTALAVARALALAVVACHRKPKPTYEYGETVTTTSDDTPPTTLPPSPSSSSHGWEKRKSW